MSVHGEKDTKGYVLGFQHSEGRQLKEEISKREKKEKIAIPFPLMSMT